MIRGIAHRGYSAKHPENTLSAFQAALDLEYSHVEFDVQLSQDGIPVLLHDYSVTRMTGQPGEVSDYTLAELRSFPLPEGERIATLVEALDLLHGDIRIMVELKQAGDLYPGLEEKALAALKETGTFDQAIVISFDHFSIARMRQLDDEVTLGLTSSCAMPYVFDFMRDMRCDLLGVPIRMLTPEYDRMITERGHVVGPWVVDTLTDMERIANEYPHALITTNELERWADFSRDRPELTSGRLA